MHRSNGFLPANTATRGDESLSRHAFEVDRDIRSEKNVDAVARAVARVLAQRAQIIRRANQSLREEKSSREFIVMSRRPHRHNEGARVDADFQRLFNGKFI